MGHKVHPKIFRIGTTTTWPSKWFMKINRYAQVLKQDVELRAFLAKELKDASMERVEIERAAGALTIIIYSAKPGFVIGRGGQGIEGLRKKIKEKFAKDTTLSINIQETEKPSLSAPIVLQAMVADIEKRIRYRRVLKQALDRVKKGGGLGGKVKVSGRLDGAEIAREEKLYFGKLPLQNLRADIDYAFGEAHTIYGKIGVHVWIYRGEVFSVGGENPSDRQKPVLGGEKV